MLYLLKTVEVFFLSTEDKVIIPKWYLTKNTYSLVIRICNKYTIKYSLPKMA